VNAALHACPELTPGGEGRPAYTGVGVGFSRLHAEVPATLPFVSDVLGDVAAITPGPFVHIGGDEALTMHAAEYDHLVRHAADVVAASGRTVVGWQEVARAPLPAGSILQCWDEHEGQAAVAGAVEGGARLVLSPASRLYLDMRYDGQTPMGSDWAGHIGLRRAYEWDPAALLPVPAHAVAGVEAAIWTENVRTPRDLFGLLLPRLAAVAEVAWSPRGRIEYDGFTERLRHITPRWDAQGLPWYRAALD
jgi:hexosaminidase